MKAIGIALACIIVGAVAGYSSAQFGNAPPEHALVAAGPPNFELSDSQLDRLAPNAAAAPAPAANALERATVFTRATQIVDLMIANRQITRRGLEQAHALLRASGQDDRRYEIQSRIAAAIDRGELTPEQAGWRPLPDS